MSQHFFVTGTGTDVGKTVVSSLLLQGFHELGNNASYWKPIQTGGANLDAAAIAAWEPRAAIHPSWMTFDAPLSPDQAAAAEHRQAPLLKDFWNAMPQSEILVTEGAGGLMVPWNEMGETWLDLLFVWPEAQIILVASSGLGTINHTSLSLLALKQRGLSPALVVLSGPKNPGNGLSLRRQFPEVNFFAVPQVDSQAKDVAVSLVKNLVPRQESSQNWIARDAKVVWHPFTQHQTEPEPLVITKAQGVWLETAEGERLLDGQSSWWTNTIGHGRPEIAAALTKQQQRLDHVIFAGATHKPAIALSEQLIAATGGQMHRAFFSDNGSCAVEIAAKMLLQFWHNAGESQRKLFVTLRGGYHGDSFGAMALGVSETFHAPFKKFFFPTLPISPVTSHPSYVCPEGSSGLADAKANLRKLFSERAHEMAGVLIEPMIQGAGGMLIQDLSWLKYLGDLAKQHRVPLILDEVFSGMGRTGEFFAFQRAHLDPAVICLAKGLTGGTMPLAVTLAKEQIFAGFLGPTKSTAFLHGHSYTANPVGCAVGLATFEIYRKENLLEKVRWMEAQYQTWIQNHAQGLALISPRALGNVLAFELPHRGQAGYHSSAGQRFVQAARRHKLFLRPLGDTIYFMPPFVISPADLDRALADLGQSVEEWSLLISQAPED